MHGLGVRAASELSWPRRILRWMLDVIVAGIVHGIQHIVYSIQCIVYRLYYIVYSITHIEYTVYNLQYISSRVYSV